MRNTQGSHILRNQFGFGCGAGAQAVINGGGAERKAEFRSQKRQSARKAEAVRPTGNTDTDGCPADNRGVPKKSRQKSC